MMTGYRCPKCGNDRDFHGPVAASFAAMAITACGDGGYEVDGDDYDCGEWEADDPSTWTCSRCGHTGIEVVDGDQAAHGREGGPLMAQKDDRHQVPWQPCMDASVRVAPGITLTFGGDGPAGGAAAFLQAARDAAECRFAADEVEYRLEHCCDPATLPDDPVDAAFRAAKALIDAGRGTAEQLWDSIMARWHGDWSWAESEEGHFLHGALDFVAERGGAEQGAEERPVV